MCGRETPGALSTGGRVPPQKEQEAILQALVEALLAALEASYPVESPFIGKLLRALQTHLLDQLGTAYLGRWVPQPRALHHRLVLSVVLLKSGMSLPEIAAVCGFRDVRHFSRSFHRVMGARPR